MAKAKKLPSGSWRVQVFSYKDASGKNHYESFTAPTKAEAEMLAAEFKATKARKAKQDLTVEEAINGYIQAKEGVLSPTTVREYQRMISRFDMIRKTKIQKITSEVIQLWISDLAGKVSPKTVRNTYALLTCSISLYSPNIAFKVTLPTKQKKRPESPSDEVVAALYHAASDEMKKCIILGIRGVRRGEISALKYEDIKDGIAHIHADFVKNSEKKWVYKEIPKTSDSDRFVRVPDLGSGEGFVVKWMPDTITKRFIELRNSLGLTIRFHDFRHYFASTAVILNIPELYCADMGGWVNGSHSVMKSVYQNKINSMSDYYAKKIDKHLQDIISV